MLIFYNFYSKYDRVLDLIFKLFISYYCINTYNFIRKNNCKCIEYKKKINNFSQTDNYLEEDDFPRIPSSSFLKVGKYLYDSQELRNK